MTTTDNDQIDRPAHYDVLPGIQAIDLMEALAPRETVTFCVFNAFKYLVRRGKKDDATFDTDSRKAIWYLKRVLDRLPPGSSGNPTRVLLAHGADSPERLMLQIIGALADPSGIISENNLGRWCAMVVAAIEKQLGETTQEETPA